MTRQMRVPTLTVKVRLQRGGPLHQTRLYWQEVTVEIPGDFTVIELVELIKGEKEPSLAYRHSCHHGSCGTCAMRVNGEERLACITGVAEVLKPGGTLTIQPLEHLPVLADLANDPGPLLRLMEAMGPGHVRGDGHTEQPVLPDEEIDAETEPFKRFGDCIECGSCISACPGADPVRGYIGPAPLVAARDAVACGAAPGGGWERMLALAAGAHGVWQCHGVFECSRVCPANIDVGGAIMTLRHQIATGRLGRKGGVRHG